MKRIFATAMVVAMASVVVPALAQNNRDAGAAGAASGAAAGAVGGALVGGPVGAAVGGIAGAAGGAIAGSLTPEDRAFSRRYVTERRVAPVMTQERVVIGQPLPRTVVRHKIVGNPRLEAYNYAYVNDQYYLVDADGRVIEEIDAAR